MSCDTVELRTPEGGSGFLPGALWPLRPLDFRRRLDALFRELRVPGLTPASLRAGGATHLFMTTQDMEAVRWKGRWQSLRTVEHYVQEIHCISVLQNMSPTLRDRLAAFAAAAAGSLRGAAASLVARAAAGEALEPHPAAPFRRTPSTRRRTICRAWRCSADPAGFPFGSFLLL